MEQKKTKKRTAPPTVRRCIQSWSHAAGHRTGPSAGGSGQRTGEICIDTLRSWLKASGVQMGQVSRQNRELEAENHSLRRQLGEKDEVIDVLKKSVGILSKP